MVYYCDGYLIIFKFYNFVILLYRPTTSYLLSNFLPVVISNVAMFFEVLHVPPLFIFPSHPQPPFEFDNVHLLKDTRGAQSKKLYTPNKWDNNPPSLLRQKVN